MVYLQVKLAHQESELASLLKRIPLGPQELNVIRDRAEQLRDGKLKSRGDALLPLTLASFIFDSLCLPGMGPFALNNHCILSMKVTGNVILSVLLRTFVSICFFTVVSSLNKILTVINLSLYNFRKINPCRCINQCSLFKLLLQ